MSYSLALNIHLTCILTSILLFIFRGILMLSGNRLLESRFLKTLPHLVDSALLIAGVYLAILTAQYPLIDHWLTVKLGLLIVYILLGSVALKYGKTKMIRSMAYASALVIFGFMISVGYYRSPYGLFTSLAL